MFQVDVDYLKKAKKRKDHGKVVILVFLTLAGAVSLLPLIYLVCTAFKPPEELFLYPPTFFVKNPTIQNFKDLTAITANSAVPFTRYLFNTILITVCYIFCLVWLLTSTIPFASSSWLSLPVFMSSPAAIWPPPSMTLSRVSS